MTDAQLTAVVAALATGGGAFIAFLKWAFGVWMADRKEERAERKAEREAQTAATLEVAKALTAMAVRFDAFERKLDKVEQGVDEVADEVTGNHRVPKRADTQPGSGYRPPRRPRQDS